jgi:NAD(P)-dependent dehydrogenase (short-subunit alcohol dehydrogenase family)
MGLEADCIRTVEESISKLGGLDIIISNAVCLLSLPSLNPSFSPSPSTDTQPKGFTRFSPFSDLSAPTEEDWDTCYAVNVKAQIHLIKAALPTFNSNPEGGAFIITSSISGRNPGGSSMPYSVTKAAQLHLMRCLASTQGPKVRVNAVLPGWLATEWVRVSDLLITRPNEAEKLIENNQGNKYSPERVKELNKKAFLQKPASFNFLQRGRGEY